MEAVAVQRPFLLRPKTERICGLNMQYYVAIEGQQRGPFSIEQILTHPAPPGALIWREGLAGWVPPQQVPELATKLVAPAHPAAVVTPAPARPGASRHPAAVTGPVQTRSSIAHDSKHLSWQDLRLIAMRQRELLIGLGIALVIYLLVFPGLLIVAEELGKGNDADREGFLLLANLARSMFGLLMSIAQFILSIRLSQALKHRNPWLWGLGSCFCFIGIFVLFVLNQQATSLLQRAGVRVGFFGTQLPVHPPT